MQESSGHSDSNASAQGAAESHAEVLSTSLPSSRKPGDAEEIQRRCEALPGEEWGMVVPKMAPGAKMGPGGRQAAGRVLRRRKAALAPALTKNTSDSPQSPSQSTQVRFSRRRFASPEPWKAVRFIVSLTAGILVVA